MSELYSSKFDSKKEAVEQDNLRTYNQDMSGKVENQNHSHNARKEGFARKERNQNS